MYEEKSSWSWALSGLILILINERYNVSSTVQNNCIKSNYQIRKVLLQTQEGCKGLALCMHSFFLRISTLERADLEHLSLQAGASSY
jgi:hypothetical protein